MKEEQGGSELAKLLRRFDEEYQAAQRALHGLALGTAQHEIITKRMENMEAAREQIEEIVGPEEATRLIVETMDSKELDIESKEDKGE